MVRQRRVEEKAEGKTETRQDAKVALSHREPHTQNRHAGRPQVVEGTTVLGSADAGRSILRPYTTELLDGVAVGVDFVDFADVQFANAGFDFGHVADHQPD